MNTVKKIDQQYLDFQPAALEITERPASPLGRLIIWVIITLFSFAVAWACFGYVDIVAVATGKIIPSDHVKVIQPLETATIKSIHVQEGQQVKAGDTLITLDQTIQQADLTQLREDLYQAELELIRLNALSVLLDVTTSEVVELGPIWERSLQSVSAQINRFDQEFQYKFFSQEVAEYQTRQQSFYSQKRALEAELNASEAQFAQFQKTLPIVKEQRDSHAILMEKSLVARAQFLEWEQSFIEQTQSLESTRQTSQKLREEITSVDANLSNLTAEYQRANSQSLNEIRMAVAALQQDIIKAEQRNSRLVLQSPIDGTVEQLSVHTLGGVVTPAQELMMIVPAQRQLEVEAMLLNKDIGFVQVGQEAMVKIDTFNFTKYGFITGNLLDVSSDSVVDETLGLVYPLRLILENNSMLIDGNNVNLSPGMSVTLEVKTGKRRVIEFFLSPLLRFSKESVRER